MEINLPLMTDSYKAGHASLYPKGIERVYSYLESRGGTYPSTVFFGLQYHLEKYLSTKVIKQHVDEAELFWKQHFGIDYFQRENWDYIVEKHNGRLPLHIKAVPEGLRVPTHNVLMTIENTDPKCAWLTNFVETLLVQTWYPITIATQSNFIKRGIFDRLTISGTPEFVDFKCHDFGYRGVTCPEQAGLGAAAHLLSFKGTDTVEGIRLLRKYYHTNEMVGYSIPATEHSIMCSFGKSHELEACGNVLSVCPDGLVACVSDTYDIYRACEIIWGTQLYNKIMLRNGCLVIRPDSGDFREVVLKVLEILWNKFGGTWNNKGYRVLDPHVRVIQGDGMNPITILELYDILLANKWSADNLAVGSGGGLLMQVNRDTQKMAMKASSVTINGVINNDVSKDPITDSGKRSKAGELVLLYENDTYRTVKADQYNRVNDVLQSVFYNGDVVKTYTYEQVVENLNCERSKKVAA